MDMSFLEQCMIFNGTFNAESTTHAALIDVDPSKDDDYTCATSVDTEDVDVDQKAVLIQSQARGMLARKKFLNRERLALDCTRSRAGHGIMKEKAKRAGIESNIRAIKKILTSNKELWESCKGNLRGEKGTHVTKFTRTGFFHVEVVTDDDGIVFSTKPMRNEKFFDTQSMVAIPDKLSGIFEVKYDEDLHVNYESLLERVQLLHEDVLGPYLVKLMEHLQSVNAGLTEISKWISEPSDYLKFLSKTFGLKQDLDIPDEESLMKHLHTEVLKEQAMAYELNIRAKFNIELDAERFMLEKVLELVSN
ncbi:unnamed protein product [Cylindrotheca closterium]|uniref:Uncharacterized protein n=1 Tax=Cylindrotheca closterium TaxID=2856 RepID=A0AAD2PUZ1_9STRA|nr:unnamed protein product [Cylindrotheca closterium]